MSDAALDTSGLLTKQIIEDIACRFPSNLHQVIHPIQCDDEMHNRRSHGTKCGALQPCELANDIQKYLSVNSRNRQASNAGNR